MEWTPGGESQDIEDRRDEGGGGGGGGFGFGGFGLPHLGIGGVLFLLILSFVFHVNLFSVFTGTDTPSQPGTPSQTGRPVANSTRDAGEQREVQFISFVLDDVQNTWDKLLPQQTGVPYRHAHLVLFRNFTESHCGTAESATGPFYCPNDEKVYLDLGFFQELSDRFGAPGEFAQAYVVAHELGHHVQKLLGIESRVRRLQQQDSTQVNPLSVHLELQADCFAGVWGYSTEKRNIIDQADIAAGLRAASSVGDDRLQKMATGHVSPETFTHGSSEQRMHWFQAGLNSGQVSACTALTP